MVSVLVKINCRAELLTSFNTKKVLSIPFNSFAHKSHSDIVYAADPIVQRGLWIIGSTA